METVLKDNYWQWKYGVQHLTLCGFSFGPLFYFCTFLILNKILDSRVQKNVTYQKQLQFRIASNVFLRLYETNDLKSKTSFRRSSPKDWFFRMIKNKQSLVKVTGKEDIVYWTFSIYNISQICSVFVFTKTRGEVIFLRVN